MDGIIVKISITPPESVPMGGYYHPISIRLGYGICKEMQVNMVLARNSLCKLPSSFPFRESSDGVYKVCFFSMGLVMKI